MKFSLTPKQLLVYFVFLSVSCVMLYFTNKRRITDEQRAALLALQNRSKTEFNLGNPAHVEQLESVKVKFEVEEWTQIGFQRRESPVTDFRAFGMLTVDYLSLTEAHNNLKKFQTGEADELPFALMVINIGSRVLIKMGQNERFLVQFSFTRHDFLKEFVRYVDQIIIDFERFWFTKKPATIMEFNQIWRQYEEKYLK